MQEAPCAKWAAVTKLAPSARPLPLPYYWHECGHTVPRPPTSTCARSCPHLTPSSPSRASPTSCLRAASHPARVTRHPPATRLLTNTTQAGVFDIDVEQSVMRDVLVLLGMLAAVRLMVYFALRHKTTFRGKK